MTGITRAEALKATLKEIGGGRVQEYGTPENNFQKIAHLWEAYMVAKYGQGLGLTPLDVAQMMVLFKMARIMATPGHYDSHLDIIGYGACGAEIAAKVPMLKTQVVMSDPDPIEGALLAIREFAEKTLEPGNYLRNSLIELCAFYAKQKAKV